VDRDRGCGNGDVGANIGFDVACLLESIYIVIVDQLICLSVHTIGIGFLELIVDF
jgi:hypothetical protein